MPGMYINGDRKKPHPDNSEEPIREELFSLERLEQQAPLLAQEHQISQRPQRGRLLLPRFEENSRRLLEAYRKLTREIFEKQGVSPAAEWLIDNFYVVEEQLRQIRVDLPKSYYYELPKLVTGEMSGYPRIYSIAVTFIAHTDSRLDEDALRRFIRAYQQVTPLTIGEIWAAAISLRLALIENLRRLTVRVISAGEERHEADRLADALLAATDDTQRAIVTRLIQQLEKRTLPGRAFVVQLTQRLRDQDPDVLPFVEWIDRSVQRQGQSIEEYVHLEHQRQAASQVSVGNIITSMRLLSTIDWPAFVESLCLTEPILGADPAGAYAEMDFSTRDRYRHVIERIARRTHAGELDVARQAVAMATQSYERDPRPGATAHVGYYLIDDGLPRLEREFNYRPSIIERARRAALSHPAQFYFGIFLALSVLIMTALLALAAYQTNATPIDLVVIAVLALIPGTDLGLSILNWDVTHTFPPRVLPKMNADAEIPFDSRTMIVVPTMLTSEKVVEELVEKLEIHFLANQSSQFFFALLTDFADASQEQMPSDGALLAAARKGIENLNARYGTVPVSMETAATTHRFYLFHRRRQWNPSEGEWMGWERKRGKLEEFNRLLRGAQDTSFTAHGASPALLAGIRYVITLDSDTHLPRDSAHKLVATIRHPLNRAEIDPQTRRVVRGYGILQPRVSVTLESSERSLFARIYSGNAAVDPYNTASSDVYQDLFAEGSFIGKGLYDVDAFQTVLEDRAPDNYLLSHDLFEGLYARAALVTDIELLDDHPAHYDTHAKRQHRWTRGDWQIARWIFPRVPTAAGRTTRNVLPLISRWKIIDNLRRSLVIPSLLVWLIAVWTWLPGSPFGWTLLAFLSVGFPVYAHVTNSLVSHPRGMTWKSYFRQVLDDFGMNTVRVALTFSFLPHQAWLMGDAIARAAYRKLISGKHLLEWMTADQTEQGSRHDRAAFLRLMAPVTLFALFLAIFIALFRPDALLVALPFLIAWAGSPMLAYFISRPERALIGLSHGLSRSERQALRLVARRTWRFFEAFVSEADHWLPPDNFQEDPRPVVAHRTSPTNIGLLLLSTLAAHDFGYLRLLQTVDRLERTLATLRRLEKFQGHLFNWYDTLTLKPLVPQYISTVDSGNLAAHLIAVKQAAIELPERKLFDARLLDGLMDTHSLLREAAKRFDVIKERTQFVSVKQLHKEIEICGVLIEEMLEAPEDLGKWGVFFDQLTVHATEVEDIAHALEQEEGHQQAGNFAEFDFWLSSILDQTRAAQADFDMRIPALVAHLMPLIERAGPEFKARWQTIVGPFLQVPVLAEIREQAATALDEIELMRAQLGALDPTEREALGQGLGQLAGSIERTARAALQIEQRTTAIAHACDELVEAMDFRFLFDERREMFVIGHSVTDGRRDHSYYDLLASESRLTSLIAIAKGDVPQANWFRLGRQLTQIEGAGRALVSWTATMFEYLMPLIVTHNYAKTLLNQTCKAVVARQIAYGQERGVPWGVSESAYNARDLQFNYQYGPFGVPGLGLKRGLSDDLVIAPYATLLAAMIAPRAAAQNMQRLAQIGALSRYGFYEAIDFTPERVPKNQKDVIIHSFMAHHQGMSLVALDNVLHEDVMQRRFHADPLIQATQLLLQERIPQGVPVARVRAEEVLRGRIVNTLTAPLAVLYDSPHQPTPITQLISNGAYSVMITSSGAGSSTCTNPAGKGFAVTRWREDATRDCWGGFCYLRDVRSGAVWSTGYQPTARAPQNYEVSFMEAGAVFKRLDGGILTQTDIVVSPEDNAEVRCISLTNRSTRIREIELTSYAEIVLAPPASDIAHPAFSNLFIETEFIREDSSIVARRRPRSQKDMPVYAVHTVVTDGEAVGAVQYETSRNRFLGRGYDTRSPLAVTADHPLSNTVGAVLDPIFSLRQRVRLQPNETARVTFSTAIAYSREHILMLADKYHDINIFDRVERLAWTKAQIEMRHLKIGAREAHLFQRLAGRVFYADSSLRPRPEILALNKLAQSTLWKYGISGDLPIVLVRIGVAGDLGMVRQILRGHEYLRLKGLHIDLVILNDHPPSYLQSLQDDIQAQILSTGMQTLQDKPGGVYLRRADLMPDEDRILLHTVARVVLVTERGTLEEQLALRPAEEKELPAAFVPRLPSQIYPEAQKINLSALQFFNGLGGFAREGREYVTVLDDGQWTPAPWTNVIANEHDFGFLVTETGGGYTWSVNSRENRLTPWSNDGVSDPPGETLYLRDEETGDVWTPTPLPIREKQAYVIRHGQGYTVFEHTSHGISQELMVFVPLDGPVKISTLRLRNLSDRRRRVSVTAYNELVLGVQREQSAPFVVTARDKDSGATFARNAYNNEFANRIAFLAMTPAPVSASCDRKSFLGRNGNLAQPAAMGRARLDGRFGAGLDPCAALQTVVEIEPGQTRDIIVLLGEGENAETARELVQRYLDPDAVGKAIERVVKYWDDTLTAVEVRTPDPAMDLMLNRWLLYQTLSCRFWARSAFYQSGGAYGFRDQLQDVMGLVYARPELTRAQILRAAAHQFAEGDVQHWWHPPTGRGVRTRISDDLLWLPYVASFYIRVTGDASILDEMIPFLDGPPLAQGEDDLYMQPRISDEKATLYEHCLRAIDRSLPTGEHGLPLMGSGDWNDGMNHVGHGGKGESVWLGWFLASVLDGFAPFCDARHDPARGTQYREHMSNLKTALEKAWDGDWYARAYFDDGTPLGTSGNTECRIDSIAQSWAVISGVADRHRATHAMAAVEEYLVHREDGIVTLFSPPFDQGTLDPGYIKGYVPGVRENGGQYTHGALWALIAYAMLGDGDRAGELFGLLNPVNHALTRVGLHKYRVEPYVVAGDVYALPPHTGRGGWSWYTGSAAWMYRAGLESMLGFQLCGDRLRINPSIPRGWREFEITYRHGRQGATRYHIRVENPHGRCHGIAKLVVDGKEQQAPEIQLVDDAGAHEVSVTLG